MEYKEAKKELKSYQYYEKRSKAQIDEITRLDSQSKKVTSVITGMPTSYNPHSLEDVWVTYIDEVNKLVEYLKKDTEAKKIIRAKLDKLKDIDQESEMILEERYINGKKVWEVADTIYYSIPTTKRKLKKAIIQYANI